MASVEDEVEYIDEERVRGEVDRVCRLLQFEPPETIVYKELKTASSMPRVKDGGRTIELYRTDDLSEYTWQISEAYRSPLIKRSSSFFIRNLKALEMVYMLYSIPNTLLVFVVLTGLEPPFSLMGVLLTQSLYVSTGFFLFRLGQKTASIISKSWLKIGRWSEDKAIANMRRYPRSIIFNGIVFSFASFVLALAIHLLNSPEQTLAIPLIILGTSACPLSCSVSSLLQVASTICPLTRL